MKPILIEYGWFFIPSWHLFFVMGVCLAFLYVLKNQYSYNTFMSKRESTSLLSLAYVFGYIGARYLDIVVNDGFSISGIFDVFDFGGLVLFGGLMGGGIASVIFLHIKKIKLIPVLDLGAVAALIGIAVGRIGCLLNGDDYGIPVGNNSLVHGIVFKSLNDQIPRHAVQLYESVFAALLFATLHFGRHYIQWLQRQGAVAAVAICGYSVGRFVLEYFRDDDRGWLVTATLSTSQGISIVTLILGLWVWYMSIRKK